MDPEAYSKERLLEAKENSLDPCSRYVKQFLHVTLRFGKDIIKNNNLPSQTVTGPLDSSTAHDSGVPTAAVRWRLHRSAEL